MQKWGVSITTEKIPLLENPCLQSASFYFAPYIYGMKTIRIIGVPEHFNFPWRQVVNEQPLAKEGYTLDWQDESRGSGAMNKALREGEADVAILLTESFIKDKTEGNPGKIIGYHVLSPLTWGIHVPAGSAVQQLEELKDAPFLISRYGSGSHLMAFLLARQNQWDTDSLKFEVIGNLDGAKASFEDNQPKTFLWEKYTTKPLVDQGLFRRIGEIPTPWPCFAIVATEKLINEDPKSIKLLQNAIYEQSKAIRNLDNLTAILGKKYDLFEEDVAAWLQQTSWAENETMDKSTLEKTVEILLELGLINEKISPEELVAKDFVKLT